MAERLNFLPQEDESFFLGYNRSNTMALPFHRHSMVASANRSRGTQHPETTHLHSSCPERFNYLSPGPAQDYKLLFSPSKAQHPTIAEMRNNSETDSSLREEIVGLSARTEVVSTLTESMEDICDDPPVANTTDYPDMLSPTSQKMRTFHLPHSKHGHPHVEESDHNSDLNSDANISREVSPFNASDSCSSMSASNSDFSSTEQKDSEPHGKKAKESWQKVRRMIMWSPFVQIYKKKYPWIQLAGHHGNFRPGKEVGTIMKKMCLHERTALEKLNEDPLLKEFVPDYSGVHCVNGEDFIEMQDLLRDFDKPALMDIKIGLRTFNEDEIAHSRNVKTWRKDLYDKMCAIDSKAPTVEENELKAISKYRYMRFRESLTSTIELGFRLEGMKNAEGISKDFKTLSDKDKIVETILEFCKFNETVLEAYIKRIRDLLDSLEQSPFFGKNQLVGTSLLFVHSTELHQTKANVWMIDFGKTTPVPPKIKINHRSEWKPGNYEDGYLFGVENTLDILKRALSVVNGETVIFRASSFSKDK